MHNLKMKSLFLDNTVAKSKHLLILNRNNMRRLNHHQGKGDLPNHMQDMRCHLQIRKVHLRNKNQDKELLLLMKLLDMRLLHHRVGTKLLLLHQGMWRLHLHLGARILLLLQMKLMHHLNLIKIHHLNNVKAMVTPIMSRVMMMAIHIMDMVKEAFGTAEMKKKPSAS